MKRKLLSVLLVLAMALTLLPTAAFAANETAGTTDPKVAGYGFVWDAKEPDAALTGGFKAGSDWMGETMYVAFAENGLDEGTHLWFEVTVGTDPNADVWGCAATASTDKDTNKVKGMFAFSFLNRTTQWEQHPENITVGADQAHAEKYLKEMSTVSEVTLNIYTTTEEFTSDKHDTTGLTPFKTLTVKIDSSKDTMEVVEDESVATPIQVVPANLTAVDGAQAPAYGHATKYTAVLTDKAIAVTAEGLEKTKNTQDVTDYWVGVGLTKQEGATYAWGFGTKPASPEYKAVERTQTNGDKTYTTLYWSSDDTTNAWSETIGYISVKVGNVVTDYTVSFNVKVKTDTPVNPPAGTLNFSTLLDNEVTEGKIYGKAPETLGKFTVEQGTGADVTKITVTGTANYITGWTEFNGDSTANENNGHYLPIQIKGEEGQKITIKGANEKTLTFGKDGSFELVMFLDKLTNSTFTVTVVNEDVTKAANTSYTIDCSGVVLLPNTTSTDTSTTVEVSEKEVESLGNLIKDSVETGKPDNNAPIKVDTSADGGKTLTFTGKDGSDNAVAKPSTTVTLPKELVEVVTDTTTIGDTTKADVKVESSSGSVTIPSETVSSDNSKAYGVTIAVEENKITDSTALKVVTDSSNPSATTPLASGDTKLIADAKGVTVTAKTGSDGKADLVATPITAEKSKITVVIAGLAPGDYVVFCIKEDGTVTKVGPATVATGASTISVTSAHLTSFVAVAETDVAKSEALKNVPDDVGAKITDSTPETPTTTATYALTDGGIGKKVTVTGEANHYYVVQIGNSAPASIFCVKANGTTAEFYVANNDASKFKIWDAGTSAASFTGEVPTDLAQVDKA